MTFCRGANLFLGLFCESAMEQNFYLRFLVERSEIELLGKIAPRQKIFLQKCAVPLFRPKVLFANFGRIPRTLGQNMCRSAKVRFSAQKFFSRTIAPSVNFVLHGSKFVKVRTPSPLVTILTRNISFVREIVSKKPSLGALRAGA